ncbi:hypothetical protein [Microbispora sp. NPDC049633]|uniref:hypothetical protein n=1 Tax=Microbispora sp. NPDC049633 TaxID=3154355 RepID=UPI0034258F38
MTTTTTAKTPTIAFARALRAFGLIQGEDFKISGDYTRATVDGKRVKQREGTTAHLHTDRARAVVVANRAEIIAAVESAGFAAFVAESLVCNYRMVVLTNFAGYRHLEIPAPAPVVEAPAPARPALRLPFEPGYFPNQEGGTDVRTGNGDLIGWTEADGDRFRATVPDHAGGSGYLGRFRDQDDALYAILAHYGTPVVEAPAPVVEAPAPVVEQAPADAAPVVISVDVVERDKAVGWVENGTESALPLWGKHEDGMWYLFAGTSDEYRGSSRTLVGAIRRLGYAANTYGRARFCFEYRGGRDMFATVTREDGPVKHDDGVRDDRYTVGQEGTGDLDRPYVARFCGTWVGNAPTEVAAWHLAWGHQLARTRENA